MSRTHFARAEARFAAALLAAVAAFPVVGSAAEALSPSSWDPLLLDAPRPSPLPSGYGREGGFPQNLVDLSDGSLRLSFIDVLLPAGPLPLVVARQYRSGLRTEGVFGSSWASNLDLRLIVVDPGTVRIVEGDGRVVSYALEANDRYSAVAGTFPASEVHRAGRNWERRWVTGLTEGFDGAGRLRERALGNARTVLGYADDGARQPTSITDGLGHEARLRYRDGLLVEVDYPSRRSVRYEYDGRRLARVTDALARKVAFTYAGGRLAGIELPGSTRLRFRYAADGSFERVDGPGALGASFAWSANADRPGVQMTTRSGGTSLSAEIAPAIVEAREWGIASAAQRLAVRLRTELGQGDHANAFVLGDKVLLDLGGERIVLDPDGKPAPARTAGTGGDRHAFRLRLTPAMTATGDPSLRYDDAGRAVAVELGDGRRESWKWDAADRVVEWTDRDGTVARYAYDELDRPREVRVGDRQVLAASYDEMGLLAHLRHGDDEADYRYSPVGRLEQVAAKNGHVMVLANDARGLPTELRKDGKVVARASYDDLGRLASVSDAQGATTRYAYDASGRPVEARDDKAPLASYRYDGQGRLVAISAPDGTRIVRDFLADGSRTTVSDADGAQTITERNAQDRIRSVKLPGSPKVEFKYGADGRIQSAVAGDGTMRRFEYDASGTLIAETDSGGGKRRYDAEGRLLERIDPDGAAWQYGYGPQGIERSTGPAGDALDYRYGGDGRLLEIRHRAGGRTASQRFKYDGAGRLAEAAHEDGTVESFAYDAEGRVSARTNRLGGRFGYSYDALGNLLEASGPYGVERYRYDDEGRVTERQDPVAGIYRMDYASGGDGVVVTDPAGSRTRLTLDAAGRLLSVQDALGGTRGQRYGANGQIEEVTDPNGQRVAFGYDEQGRLTETRTAAGRRVLRRYDDKSRLVETKVAGDATISARYDAGGRLSELSTSEGETWRYAYDAGGNPVTVAGPSGTLSYAYDALGRLVAAKDSSGPTVQVAYDLAGRTSSVEAPDGGKLGYRYNEHSQLSEIQTSSGVVAFSYDDAARLSRTRYPNGVSTTYRYVVGTRIASISTTDAQGRVLLGETYEYDARGNVTAIARQGGIAQQAGAEGPAKALVGTTRFAYDALNRVVEASYPDGLVERFKYDAAGSLIEYQAERLYAGGAAHQELVPYSYDADQALIAHGSAAAPDARGNLCAERVAGVCDSRYDAFNRLIAWRDQSYSYDGYGRLASWRDRQGHGARFYYTGNALFAEQASDTDEIKVFVPGVQSGIWSAMRSGTKEYFPIRSANGSLLALTDGTGAVVEACSYRTYTVGSSWSAGKGGALCEFAGGRQLGPGTWFGARVLSAVGMRFMSPDPAGPDRDGNRYSYALDNPLRFVDLLGAAGEPVTPTNPWPQYEQPVWARIGEMATGPADRPATRIAQNVLEQRATGTLQIRTYQYAERGGQAVYNIAGNTSRDITKAASGRTIANVYVEAQMRSGGNLIDGLTRTAIHEAVHIEQNLQRGIEGNQYRLIHEVEAYLTEWRVDPTLGRGGGYMSPTDVVNWVVDQPAYANVPRSSTLREKAMVQGKNVWIEGEPTFADRVNKLKQLRTQAALNQTPAVPPAPPLEPPFPPGPVDRALAAHVGAPEVTSAESAGIRRAAQSALNAAESTLEATYDKAGGAAKKAFDYVANKLAPAGRALGGVAPVAVQLAAIKGAIDLAIGIGKAAGETAADIYDAYRRGRDAILDPLDKLAREIDASNEQDERARKRKKAQRQELVNTNAPEPAQIGQAPGGGASAPPGSASPPGIASNAPAQNPSGPDNPLGPNNPLGGSPPPSPPGASPPGNAGGPTGQPAPGKDGSNPQSPQNPPGAPPGGSPAPGGGKPNVASGPDPGSGPKPGAGPGPDKPLGGSAATPPGTPPPGAQQPGAQPPKPPRPEGEPPPGPKNPLPPDQKPQPPKPEAKPQPGNPPPGSKPAAQPDAESRKVKDWAALCGSSPQDVVTRMQNRTIDPALVPRCLCFGFLMRDVPDLSPEMVIKVPEDRAECGAFIASLKRDKPEQVAKTEPPAKPKPGAAEPPPPAPKPATADPQPGRESETPTASQPEPPPAPGKPPAGGPSEAPPTGLAKPSVPDFPPPPPPAEPRPPPASTPSPGPTAGPSLPSAPSSTPSSEPQKPDLYQKGPITPASAMTPRDGPGSPASSSSNQAGGGLRGTYNKVIGWLDYVSRRVGGG